MFNFKHLKIASSYANLSNKSTLYQYCWHFIISIKQAIFLAVLSVFSIVHAIVPWAFDFKLLEWRISELKGLKDSLPNDPQLNKVDFK
jgi:hypothetical protein